MKERFDKEKAKRNIEEILEKLHSGADISLLNEYHKLYKKEISIFRRSWAAAWLLMYYDGKETPDPRRIKTPSVPVNRKTSQEEDKTSVRVDVVLKEEESKRLFISIGKNRRLFPKDIITLIMSKTSAAREDIGMIRILDNYSFVQVRDTKANEIIETLNGNRFRGRTLAVNFAKPKNSEESEK